MKKALNRILGVIIVLGIALMGAEPTEDCTPLCYFVFLGSDIIVTLACILTMRAINRETYNEIFRK